MRSPLVLNKITQKQVYRKGEVQRKNTYDTAQHYHMISKKNQVPISKISRYIQKFRSLTIHDFLP